MAAVLIVEESVLISMDFAAQLFLQKAQSRKSVKEEDEQVRTEKSVFLLFMAIISLRYPILTGHLLIKHNIFMFSKLIR